MEDARYWMWPKRKSSSFGSQIRATTNPNYGASWEEQAFAEDASGALGGCVWPPRSYSCTFCRREFRSAQALGGHMNIHRKDRAALKQSLSPNNEIFHHENSYNQSTCPSTSSQVCTFVYNPNSDLDRGFLASPSSPSRVLVRPSELNCDEKVFLPLFSKSIVQESNKKALFGNRSYNISDFKKEEKDSKILGPTYKVSKGDENYIKADLSVTLNLFVCRSEDKDEAIICSKRQKTDSTSSFLVKQSSKMIELGPKSIEGLDLELRLGENPKVK